MGDAITIDDVGIKITPAKQRDHPGQRTQLKAVVTNHGPSPATDVAVTFRIPKGFVRHSVMLVSSSATSPLQATCRTTNVVCTIGGLQPGAKVIYRIVGTVKGKAPGKMKLEGTVTHGEADTKPPNDEDSGVIRIVPPHHHGPGHPPGPGSPTPATPDRTVETAATTCTPPAPTPSPSPDAPSSPPAPHPSRGCGSC